MISVIVQRGNADNQGQDIADSIISTEEMAIQRGRIEIDKQSTDRYKISGTCPITDFIYPGSIVSITDMEKGELKGMARGFSITASLQNDAFAAKSHIIVEKE